MTFIETELHRRVFESNRHLLVLGGPGSGKTLTALHKAYRFIGTKRLKPAQKVLFLSFSRAAVARILHTASTQIQIVGFSRYLAIQTFHSWFWEILKTHGYLLGSPHKLQVLAPHDEDALRQGREVNDSQWLEEREALFYDEGRVAFDLFAPLTMIVFNNSRTLREHYKQKHPLIVIDEAQDTDAVQWECIKRVASGPQLLLLADLDQQIHDYRPDVTSERIQDIRNALNPVEIDFANLNHRNSATNINACARAVLNNSNLNQQFTGVSCIYYQPRANARDRKIRQSIGILNDRIKEATGEEPANIAFLASWGKGVRLVSNALRGHDNQSSIAHRVQFDETATYLSSRLIAFLMEPIKTNDEQLLMQGLHLIGNLERAKGNLSEVLKYDRWYESIEDGTIPKRGKVISELLRIINEIGNSPFTGNPEVDWKFVRSLLVESNSGIIKTIGQQAEYLMAFNRGRMISAGLTRRWQENGEYRNARSVLDTAIVEAQIGHDIQPNHGIHVMTIHKAKGKEFDGVILFQNDHSCPFTLPKDSKDYKRSRKLLFVGISRARKHVILLRDVSQKCPITGAYIF